MLVMISPDLLAACLSFFELSDNGLKHPELHIQLISSMHPYAVSSSLQACIREQCPHLQMLAAALAINVEHLNNKLHR